MEILVIDQKQQLGFVIKGKTLFFFLLLTTRERDIAEGSFVEIPRQWLATSLLIWINIYICRQTIGLEKERERERVKVQTLAVRVPDEAKSPLC